MKGVFEDNNELFLRADELRKTLVGDEVSYIRNRNINFTNICAIGCSFCAFSKKPSDADGWTLHQDEIGEKVFDAVKKGCSEICLQGGINPLLGMGYYTSLLRFIRSISKEIHIHAFSPMEIFHISKKESIGYEKTISILKENGLDSIPGTSAEILDDGVRKEICPKKLPVSEWVRIIKIAHRLNIPSTATILYGHIETKESIFRHLELIKSIQEETGGFTEFIPLLFIPYKTGLKDVIKDAMGLKEALKMIAISRVFFGRAIKNIQASWVKLGMDGAREALKCGANDIGGTLIEENITHSAGAKTPQGLSVEEIKSLIMSIGRIPIERDTLYRRINSK